MVHYTEITAVLGERGDKLRTKKGSRLIHFGYGTKMEGGMYLVHRVKMWDVDAKVERQMEAGEAMRAADRGELVREDWQ